MRKKTYNWLHFPTGIRGESEFEQMSQYSQAIRLVN
jgi:hypothetical protein